MLDFALKYVKNHLLIIIIDHITPLHDAPLLQFLPYLAILIFPTLLTF
jgi:hypothetical protein